MFLVRLIYASTAQGILTPIEYQKILMSSIKNNREVDITGILCCDGKYFLQCLEGSRQVVNSTYSRIINDPRHKDVMLLSYGQVAARHFSDWAMSYVALSSNAAADIEADVLLRLVGGSEDEHKLKPSAISLAITRQPFLKYSIKREFNPYALSDVGSLGLLEELSQVLAR